MSAGLEVRIDKKILGLAMKLIMYMRCGDNVIGLLRGLLLVPGTGQADSRQHYDYTYWLDPRCSECP